MHMEGCLKKTVDFLREDAVYIGVVAIFVAVVMVSIRATFSDYTSRYLDMLLHRPVAT